MIRERINLHIKNNYERLKEIASRFSNSYDCYEDILQESLMYIVNLSDEKLQDIEPYLDKYIMQIIKLSFISKTSAYQMKYNKLKKQECIVYDILDYQIEDVGYDYEIDEKVSVIEKCLNDDCSFYEESVFKEYVYTDKSFNVISKECNIPVANVYETYKKALTKIRKKIKYKI